MISILWSRPLRTGCIQMLSHGSWYGALPCSVIYHQLLRITDLIRPAFWSVPRCCSSALRPVTGRELRLWWLDCSRRRPKEAKALQLSTAILCFYCPWQARSMSNYCAPQTAYRYFYRLGSWWDDYGWISLSLSVLNVPIDSKLRLKRPALSRI